MSKFFFDALVVYPSEDGSGRFVAHSLRTDQIGVDDSIEGAVQELAFALVALFEEHQRDRSVQIECPAPDNVQQLFIKLRKKGQKSKLPDEIMERVAARTASRGKVQPSPKKRLTTPLWRHIDNLDTGLVPA